MVVVCCCVVQANLIRSDCQISNGVVVCCDVVVVCYCSGISFSIVVLCSVAIWAIFCSVWPILMPGGEKKYIWICND